MNEKTPATNRDGLITALAILVLVIGVATDNAFAILGMALFAMAVIAVMFRDRIRRPNLLVVGVSALIAVATAFTAMAIAT